LSVVAFHADLRGFSGGFIGVDIFFVISGYLISGIIFSSLERGSFRVRDFYVRRANRILPALLCVLAVIMLLGWIVMMPSEFRSLGKHTFGGSAFISNVLLWREAGYFDSPLKPLLHLWSLAVEEQFYLVWPAFAYVVYRLKWNVAGAILLIVILSFGANILAIARSDTVAAFYFVGTRVWEIACGALLAGVGTINESNTGSEAKQRSTRNGIAAAVAIVVLIFAMRFTDANTPWPGSMALLPVASALLLIASGPNTWISRNLLANRMMIAIGLISYPLYLWHWPLIVTAKLVNGGSLPASLMLLIVATAFVLAWGTYRLIEFPIRYGEHKARSAAVLCIALAILGVLGVLIHRGIIAPRLYAAAVALDRAQQDWEYPGDGGFKSFGGTIVVDSIPGLKAEAIALIGDSHVQQYWPRIAKVSKDSMGRVPTALFFAYGSCLPLPSVERKGGNSPLTHKPFECVRYHQQAMKIIMDRRIKSVAYVAYWENYLSAGAAFLESHGSSTLLTPHSASTDTAFALFAEELKALRAAGKSVYVILSNPAGKDFDPLSRLPSRLPWRNARPARNQVPLDEVLRRTAPVKVRLERAAAIGGASIIDPVEALCSDSACPTIASDGSPLYMDDNHLRASVVREHARFLDQIMLRK
jgi:peptidoglycan/LPS O-acetylase OafA/YrhL